MLGPRWSTALATPGPPSRGARSMSKKRLAANRRNALRSTGPKTEKGTATCRNNALRHGLRALQTVIPGEEPAEWEIHRDAVLADLDPQGALETALAEQVAAKLWRLARVTRHEADLIANGQDRDEVRHAHDERHSKHPLLGVKRTDIPTHGDVEKARGALTEAAKAFDEYEAGRRFLEDLAGVPDDEVLVDWSVYELLKKALSM